MSFSTVAIQQVGAGTSMPILFKQPRDTFRALLATAITSGSVTYKIEFTLESSLATWVTLGAEGRTASSSDSLAFPVYAVRINVTSGSGTVKLVASYQNT